MRMHSDLSLLLLVVIICEVSTPEVRHCHTVTLCDDQGSIEEQL